MRTRAGLAVLLRTAGWGTLFCVLFAAVVSNMFSANLGPVSPGQDALVYRIADGLLDGASRQWTEQRRDRAKHSSTSKLSKATHNRINLVFSRDAKTSVCMVVVHVFMH